MIVLKKYKCPICNLYDSESDMVKDKYNSTVRRFHPKCHSKYLKTKEEKQREKKELDQLIETIKVIHDIKVVPGQFYPYIQDWRNGNELFGNIGEKKYKDGYSYDVIRQAYIESKNNIEWAIKNKNFKNTMGMLKYTRRIVEDKFEQINSRVKHLDQQINTFEIDSDEGIFVDSDIEYNKKSDEMDISQFL